MAFPAVQATNTSTETDTATTSHTVNLPGSISSGDLLIIWFGIAFPDGQTITWPGGYTQFASGIETGGGDAAVYVAYRQADGTEGSTITVTSSAGTRSAHVSYRITGHENPSTQAPEGAGANATNSQTDTPNLTPTGGAKDYLWFSGAGRTADDVSTLSAPTNYGNIVEVAASPGAAGVLTHTARRTLNASSENPGAWSGGDATAEWGGVTAAIHPASGTTTTDNQAIYTKGQASATDNQVLYAGGGVFPFTDTFTGSNDDPWDADKWTTEAA